MRRWEGLHAERIRSVLPRLYLSTGHYPTSCGLPGGSGIMSAEAVHRLLLEALADGVPVIPEEAVGFYKQNCMVAFHHNGHSSGVILAVHGNDIVVRFEICWTGETTEQLIRAYRDPIRLADNAACAIALLLIRKMTPFTAVEQSVVGTTIDYYLARQDRSDDLIFNNVARLEVSGILTENEENTIDRRIAEKRRRLRHEADLNDFIVVVEFGRPWSKLVDA